MNKADVLHLFDYMYWANSRLLEAAAALPRDQFVEPGTVTTRDLRATLVHELDVEWSWRLALQGTSSEEFDALPDLRPEDYADVAALREHWVRDEADMRAWLAQMTDDQLAADATVPLRTQAVRARGLFGRDAAALEAALDGFERMGARPYVARVRCELARQNGDGDLMAVGLEELRSLGDQQQLARFERT